MRKSNIETYIIDSFDLKFSQSVRAEASMFHADSKYEHIKHRLILRDILIIHFWLPKKI
jgi:hypothetical protein